MSCAAAARRRAGGCLACVGLAQAAQSLQLLGVHVRSCLQGRSDAPPSSPWCNSLATPPLPQITTMVLEGWSSKLNPDIRIVDTLRDILPQVCELQGSSACMPHVAWLDVAPGSATCFVQTASAPCSMLELAACSPLAHSRLPPPRRPGACGWARPSTAPSRQPACSWRTTEVEHVPAPLIRWLMLPGCPVESHNCGG